MQFQPSGRIEATTLPTPSTSHVNYDTVYEPAEDSFLVLDVLASSWEQDFLRLHFSTNSHARVNPPLVVEIGPGSGLILAFTTAHAKSIFGREDVLTLGVDISAFACKATRETVYQEIKERQEERKANGEGTRQHGNFLDTVNGDLATCFRANEIDVLVFNPPYVPSELPELDQHTKYNDASGPTTFDQESHLLKLAYAGGEAGMEVTNRLLDALPAVLSQKGVAYILLCAQNKPDQVAKRIESWGNGWSVKVVGLSGKKAGWESLSVLRIWRP